MITSLEMMYIFGLQKSSEAIAQMIRHWLVHQYYKSSE